MNKKVFLMLLLLSSKSLIGYPNYYISNYDKIKFWLSTPWKWSTNLTKKLKLKSENLHENTEVPDLDLQLDWKIAQHKIGILPQNFIPIKIVNNINSTHNEQGLVSKGMYDGFKVIIKRDIEKDNIVDQKYTLLHEAAHAKRNDVHQILSTSLELLAFSIPTLIGLISITRIDTVSNLNYLEMIVGGISGNISGIAYLKLRCNNNKRIERYADLIAAYALDCHECLEKKTTKKIALKTLQPNSYNLLQEKGYIGSEELLEVYYALKKEGRLCFGHKMDTLLQTAASSYLRTVYTLQKAQNIEREILLAQLSTANPKPSLTRSLTIFKATHQKLLHMHLLR